MNNTVIFQACCWIGCDRTLLVNRWGKVGGNGVTRASGAVFFCSLFFPPFPLSARVEEATGRVAPPSSKEPRALKERLITIATLDELSLP